MRVKPLVVVSYNIHRGIGLDRRRDLDRIAAVIEELQPDVVGLQEVMRHAGPAEADQAGYLARRLGMDLAMGATRELGAGLYGNAVLSRWPIVASATHDLSHGRRERRGALRVDLAGGGTVVHVFNCHFGLAFRERRRQIALLGEFIGVSAERVGPRVLMGDFNEWHPGPVARRLRREFASPMRRLRREFASPVPRLRLEFASAVPRLRLEFASPVRRLRRTHPSVFPVFALDRIYWDADLEGRELRAHRSRLAALASDHLPLVARLTLRHPASTRAGHAVGDALPPAE
jgi:endonuclease/exonuclease/phosphatase family metal-dependent hydrolase